MGFQQVVHDSESDSESESESESESVLAEKMERIAVLREENRALRLERENADRVLEEVVAERLRLALEKDRLYKQVQEIRKRRK